MDLISNSILKKIIILFLVIALGLFSVEMIYDFEQKSPVAVPVFNPDNQPKDKLDKEHLINYLLQFDIRNSKEILQKSLPILGSNQQQKVFKEILNNPLILINQISNSLIGIKMNDPVSILQAELSSTVITQKESSSTLSDDKSSPEKDIGKTGEFQKKTSPQKRQAVDKVQETELNFSQTEQSQQGQQLYDNNLIGVYYTHTSESYEKSVSNFHSKPGTTGDVVEVGTELIRKLESKYGIQAVHSTNVNDSVYRKSYLESRKIARQVVDNNPNLQMLFDIHRDALAKQDKDEYTATINGNKVAKIMIVVAKADSDYGLSHPEWKKNLRFARKLANKINSMYPELLKRLKVVENRRYNQDIHPNTLLLEFGGISNTTAEAKRSARLMADVVASFLANEMDN